MRFIFAILILSALVGCSSHRQDVTMTRGSTLHTNNLSVTATTVRIYGKDIPIPDGAETIRVKTYVKDGNGQVYVEFQPMNSKLSIGINNDKLME